METVGAERRNHAGRRSRLSRLWGVYALAAIVVAMIVWPALWPLAIATPALLLGADADFLDDDLPAER